MTERDFFQFRTSLSLVASICVSLREFYTQWSETFKDIKPLHDELWNSVEALKTGLRMIAGEEKSYKDLNLVYGEVSNIRTAVLGAVWLARGPSEMAKTGRDLITVLEKAISIEERVSALSKEQGDSVSEEDRVLSLLKEDELAQVYEWIEGRV